MTCNIPGSIFLGKFKEIKMKKLAFILAAVATLTSNGVHAQSRVGSGAQAGTYSTTNFAWGLGLGMLVVTGVIVGVVAGTAASSPSSFSH